MERLEHRDSISLAADGTSAGACGEKFVRFDFALELSADGRDRSLRRLRHRHRGGAPTFQEPRPRAAPAGHWIASARPTSRAGFFDAAVRYHRVRPNDRTRGTAHRASPTRRMKFMISYATEPALSAAEFIDVLRRS